MTVILHGSHRRGHTRFDCKWIGALVIRPLEFRFGLLIHEIFEPVDVLLDGTILCDYRRLERAYPLMSATEKALDPRRLPI